MKWLPLESNPEALNVYASKLGLSTAKARFVDVFGFDEELLQMVPRPVHAVMLLYPLTPKSEAYSAAEAERIAKEGQKISDNVFYMRQTIGNACGTIGLLHALGSHTEALGITDDSILGRFYSKAKQLDPEARAKLLEEDGGIASAHSDAVNDGDTNVPDITEQINLHFICFTVVDGTLYELDGRKEHAIAHGPATEATCLESSARVIKDFMKRDPENLNFNAVCLTSGEPLF